MAASPSRTSPFKRQSHDHYVAGGADGDLDDVVLRRDDGLGVMSPRAGLMSPSASRSSASSSRGFRGAAAAAGSADPFDAGTDAQAEDDSDSSPSGRERLIGAGTHSSTTFGQQPDGDSEGTAEPNLYPNGSKLLCATIPGPPWVRTIILSESCERFGYYGLRSILVVYLSAALHFDEPTAVALFSYSSSMGYFMTLVGGIVADTWLGKFWTIFSFGIVYCIGSLILAVSSGFYWAAGTFLALFLIGIGTGGIKPCVSTFGGDQFKPNQATDVQQYFMVFYFAMNIGATASQVTTPLLKNYVGYPAAFGSPFLLLSVAVLMLWLSRHKFTKVPPSGSMLVTSAKVAYAAWRNRHTRRSNEHFLDAAGSAFAPHVIASVKCLLHLLPVFALLPAFWMCFNQQGSSWTLQATHMDSGFLQPEQMQSAGSILVLLTIPVFDRIYVWLRKSPRQWLHPTPLRRMCVGMWLTAASFVLAALLQFAIEDAPPNSVSMFWQLPQYVVVTAAEILVSTTGLEFAYAEAPPSMKSTIMALFLSTVALGDTMTGILFNMLAALPVAWIFTVITVIMAVVALVFLRVATNFTSLAHLSHDTVGGVDIEMSETTPVALA